MLSTTFGFEQAFQSSHLRRKDKGDRSLPTTLDNEQNLFC